MRSTLLAVSLLWFAPSLDGVLEKLDRWLDLQLAAVVDAGTKPPADSGAPVIDAGKPDAGGVLDAGVADAGRDAGSGVVDAVVPPAGAMPRPAASKGVGFFVVNGKIYDGNGVEFIARGSNRNHIDSQSKWYGRTAANATRLLADPEPYIPWSYERVLLAMTDPNMGGTTANGKDVQIPGAWLATCSNDLTLFERIVQRWVDSAARFQASSERYMWLNIANEALSDFVVWRDKHIDAVKRIRAAGWNGLILVDAPGCGQQGMAIVQHGAAIVAADPQHNTAFDWHVYGAVGDRAGGYVCQWCQLELVPTMDALKSSGLAVVIGEFGPGRNIGPSPTTVTPERILALADERGFGTLSWSMDNFNLPNEGCDDSGFCHSRDQTLENLTIFGRVMVDYWARMAKTASTF